MTLPDRTPEGTPKFDAYRHYSHFGGQIGCTTDEPQRLRAGDASIDVSPGVSPEGLWYSLAGPAIEKKRLFDANDLLGLEGLPSTRVPVKSVAVDVSGSGRLILQISDAEKKPVWSKEVSVSSTEIKRIAVPVVAQSLGKVKFLSWQADPSARLTVRAIGFEADRPKLAAADWLFRISWGKLRRCHDPASGITGSRAHTRLGDFAAVPASGMNALVTAVAAKEKMFDPKQAEKEVRQTAQALLTMENARGFLPHFIASKPDGSVVPLKNSEYSTIDTALGLQAVLLAADVLELNDVSQSIRQAIQEIQWDGMFDKEGYPLHGISRDKTTLLSGSYKPWGGEAALIVLLEAMGRSSASQGKLNPDGKIYRGVGFIAEIQSLLHPDFDRAEPDKLSGISWPDARRKLLSAQSSYFTTHYPDSPAAKDGIWGLSAGTGGMPGSEYAANGVDSRNVQWIHPHYQIMATMADPSLIHPVIRSYYQAGLLFPRGLPEVISMDCTRNNPLQCSLNAAFEALASYHAWKRPLKTDLIDHASMNDPMIRRGMARLFDARN